MSDRSKIEWCNASWNPLRARDARGKIGWHCVKVSDGCKHCYAETMNRRLGTGLPYAATWKPQVYLDEKALLLPLRWRKPRRIFVCSMTDLFGEWVPNGVLRSVWQAMTNAQQHTFMVLTKRPERMRHWLMEMWQREPLPNVWLGVSVEDQATADARITELCGIAAAKRFVSCEPLLNRVDLGLDSWFHPGYHGQCSASGLPGAKRTAELLHWVIAGGESGPNARPPNPDWFRSLRDQCVAARVPFLFKQWGEYGATGVDLRTGAPVFRSFESEQQWVNKGSTWSPRGTVCVDANGMRCLRGGDFAKAKYPVAILQRIGKKRAGRELDGVTWNQVPA